VCERTACTVRRGAGGNRNQSATPRGTRRLPPTQQRPPPAALSTIRHSFQGKRRGLCRERRVLLPFDFTHSRFSASGRLSSTTGCTMRHPAPHVVTRPTASQPSAPNLLSSGTVSPSFVKSATVYSQRCMLFPSSSDLTRPARSAHPASAPVGSRAREPRPSQDRGQGSALLSMR